MMYTNIFTGVDKSYLWLRQLPDSDVFFPQIVSMAGAIHINQLTGVLRMLSR